MAGFPFVKQLDAMDCGPACLRMISLYYGRNWQLQTLRQRSYITRKGVSLLGISEAAESIGMRSMGVRISLRQMMREAPLPCIAHWKQNHFVVVYRVTGKRVYVSDPAFGKTSYSYGEFLKGWIGDEKNLDGQGICMLLEPGPGFFHAEEEDVSKSGLLYLLSYLKPHRKFIVQLILGLVFGSLIQLVFPFLTQQVVDFGINNQDLAFIYLILIAQLVLFLGRMSVDFIRGWILLHLGTRINISLISDFLTKLMKLPLSFFDIKFVGDLLQRIHDHRRIETFLTSATLNILFSFVNFVIFGVVIAIYSFNIFFIFLAGSLLYVSWIYLFMRRRRVLDYKRFSQMSENQDSLIQIISGIQEIKLNNTEQQKRWAWEQLQARLFRVNIRSLALNQYQQAGGTLINETKNILITIFTATAVVNGNMTLGMMLAVQYIIGQLNSPLDQMIMFFHRYQDAKISLERLGEVHEQEDEEYQAYNKIKEIPAGSGLKARNLVFRYEGPRSPRVLDQVDLEIPPGKVTAIVGASGSGKTTLMKILLGFYEPSDGEVRVGDMNLDHLSRRAWRNRCGVVMQNGYIFQDTIAANICMGDEQTDVNRLLRAIRVARLDEFIDSLPMGSLTKTGPGGQGLSEGQKQRILIARAVYKNPDFLFFDEATNSLDAGNEKNIMENLQQFFNGKTVLIIAHRLSTVKNADQIVVLEKGKIIERGNHEELTRRKGRYFELVRDQLELGQ